MGERERGISYQRVVSKDKCEAINGKGQQRSTSQRRLRLIEIPRSVQSSQRRGEKGMTQRGGSKEEVVEVDQGKVQVARRVRRRVKREGWLNNQEKR